jgi:pyruvate ferredoxin oxidoreductase gamma subunit
LSEKWGLFRNMTTLDKITDIRFHGRGGQGVMTCSYLISEAALLVGKYIHAFPSFGPERAGAPIAAFARLSDEKFYIKTEVYEPDFVVCQDPTLLKDIDILAGLKKDGVVIVNVQNPSEADELRKRRPDAKIGTIDATKIAMEEIGRPATNTAVLGALVKMTNIVTMESLENAINDRFPTRIAEKNLKAVHRSFEEVQF